MSNSVLTNGKKSLNGMKRILLLVGLAVAAALPARAADYVFEYNGGSITGTITVLVDSTGTECPLKVDNVYGGGNEANVEGNSEVKLEE